MLTRDARGDSNPRCTLDSRISRLGSRRPHSGTLALTVCATRTPARVPPFVLRSAQNPSISLPFRNGGGCRGEPQKYERKWMVLLAAASASEKCRKVAMCLRTCSQAPPFSGLASARGFTAEYVVACTSAHRTQAPRIGRSHSLAQPARCLRALAC